MAEERIIYRVAFPVEEDGEETGKTVSMKVSAHPLTSRVTVKHQVWLALSKCRFDLDPTKGKIRKVGTEMVSDDSS